MKKLIKFLSLLTLLVMSMVFIACDKENSVSSNHEHEYVTTVTEATCTADGERVKTCVSCDFYESEKIPALGHSFGEWYVTKEASCKEEGEECKSCRLCGFVDTRMLFVTDHSYSWKVSTEATCQEEGEEVGLCLCGATSTRKIDILEHDFVDGSCTACRQKSGETD